jgi:hypothetical protein
VRYKSSRPRGKARSIRAQKSNNRELARLLRTRRYGPRCSRTPKKLYELAPPHVSPRKSHALCNS